MAYGSRPTPANPALLAFLLDQSQAMAAPGQSGQTKAEEATGAINRLIYLMAQYCVPPENPENPVEQAIEDRTSIIVVGYNSGEAAPLLGDTLANTAGAPLRVESNTYEVQAEDGTIEAQTFELPVYLETVATGDTLATPAFEVARDAIAGWSQGNWNSFPPIVIHITAGLPADVDAMKPQVKALQELATQDGSLLLFHIVLGAEGETDVLLPIDDSYVEVPHAKGLAELSSVLPPHVMAMTRKVGFQTEDNARGALLPGGMAALDYFLNAVAFVATGLAWDEDPADIAADAASAQEANAEAAAAGATATPEGTSASAEAETTAAPEPAPAAATEQPVEAKSDTEEQPVDDFILPEPAEPAPLPALPSPMPPSLTRKAPSIGVPALPSLPGVVPHRPPVEPVSTPKPKSVVPSALAMPVAEAPELTSSSTTVPGSSSSVPSLPYMSKARSLPTEPLVPSSSERPPLAPVRQRGEGEASPIMRGGAKTVPHGEFGLSDDLVSEAKAALEKAPIRRPNAAPMPRPPVGQSLSTNASAMGISGGQGLRKIEDLDVRSGATMKMPVIRKSTDASTPAPAEASAPAPGSPPANMPSIPMAGPPGESPAVPPMRAPKLPPRTSGGPPPAPSTGGAHGAGPYANRPSLPVGGGIGKDTSSLAAPATGAPASSPAAAPYNAMEAHTVALPQPGWAKKRPPQPPAGIPGRPGTGPIPTPPLPVSGSAAATPASTPTPSADAPKPAPTAGLLERPPGAPKGGRMPPITQAKSGGAAPYTPPPAPGTATKPDAAAPATPATPGKPDAKKTLSPIVGPQPQTFKIMMLCLGIIAVAIILLVLLFKLVPSVKPLSDRPAPLVVPTSTR